MKTIWSLIKLIPTLITAIRDILNLVKEMWSDYQEKKRLERLDKAIEEAKRKKDTSELEDFFGNRDSKPPSNGG